jgi:hypothetical protein
MDRRVRNMWYQKGNSGSRHFRKWYIALGSVLAFSAATALGHPNGRKLPFDPVSFFGIALNTTIAGVPKCSVDHTAICIYTTIDRDDSRHKSVYAMRNTPELGFKYQAEVVTIDGRISSICLVQTGLTDNLTNLAVSKYGDPTTTVDKDASSVSQWEGNETKVQLTVKIASSSVCLVSKPLTLLGEHYEQEAATANQKRRDEAAREAASKL